MADNSVWRETKIVTVLGPDGNPFRYNLARVGPAHWLNLRQCDFGDDFEMPTASSLVPLENFAKLGR